MFIAGNKNFIYVGITVEAPGESRFYKNGDAKFWKLVFQRPDRSRQQQAVPHRAETY